MGHTKKKKNRKDKQSDDFGKFKDYQTCKSDDYLEKQTSDLSVTQLVAAQNIN